MTFLDPIAGIVAAGIGLPVLVVLYLLKLRRRPVRVSTTLFWPVATEDVQANVPLKMLRPSWLLLLHVLILAAFATALARPLIVDGSPPAERVILLLDTSASMGAVEAAAGKSRLDEAKARALEFVDELRRGSGRREVCVVTFAAEARAVTGFTNSRAVVADALSAAQQTDQPGNLVDAIKLADAIASGAGEAEEGAEPPTTVLLSDGAFRDEGKLPASVSRVRFERIGVGEAGLSGADNVGVVGFTARRDAGDPVVVRVFVDVLNAGAEGVTVPLALSVNGEVVQRRALEVGGAVGARAGRSNTIFELRNVGGGVVVVSVGREDALASDNSAGLVLPPAERPAILLVVPDDAGDGTNLAAATWILEDVLTELRSRSFRRVTASEYERMVEAGVMEADVVLFDRVLPRRMPRVPTISFGAVPAVEGLEVGEESERGTNVLFWQRSHPVLRNVALDSVLVSRGRPLRIVLPPAGEGGAAVEAKNTVTDLMRGADGPLMVMVQEGEGGVRRLISGFELPASNWSLQAGFPIFLADAIDFLTLRADAAAGRFFRTGEAVEVRVKPGVAGRVSLRGPVEVELRSAGAEVGAATLSAGLLPRAGVYLVDGVAALDRAVAVNLVDDLESSLASPASLEVAGRVVEGVSGIAVPREVWWWFVLIGAGLLMVEWVVYGWSVRA